jgi:hypothetical protein
MIKQPYTQIRVERLTTLDSLGEGLADIKALLAANRIILESMMDLLRAAVAPPETEGQA